MHALANGLFEIAGRAGDVDLAERALRAWRERQLDLGRARRDLGVDRGVEVRVSVAGVLDDREDVRLRRIVRVVGERLAVRERECGAHVVGSHVGRQSADLDARVRTLAFADHEHDGLGDAVTIDTHLHVGIEETFPKVLATDPLGIELQLVRIGPVPALFRAVQREALEQARIRQLVIALDRIFSTQSSPGLWTRA